MSVADAPSARKMSEKPSDEEQRVDERRAARARDVVERHPRDEGDVARDERQHTRREKAGEPSAERDRHTDGARQFVPGSGHDAHDRRRPSRLLKWYFALKYRVFRRERRPATDDAGW